MLRRLAVGFYALIAIGLVGLGAQTITKSIQLSQDPTGKFNVDTSNNVYFPAHVNTAGPLPVVSSCGTSAANVGSDQAGQITTGNSASTSCILSFASAYTSTPFCTANLNVTSPVGIVPTTAGATFSYSSQGFGALIFYNCVGRSTG